MPGEPDLEGAREPMQGRAEWVLELFERIERRAEA
jgi:hypothetical protein